MHIISDVRALKKALTIYAILNYLQHGNVAGEFVSIQFYMYLDEPLTQFERSKLNSGDGISATVVDMHIMCN